MRDMSEKDFNECKENLLEQINRILDESCKNSKEE
jgi:hypothetical protein